MTQGGGGGWSGVRARTYNFKSCTQRMRAVLKPEAKLLSQIAMSQELAKIIVEEEQNKNCEHFAVGNRSEIT